MSTTAIDVDSRERAPPSEHDVLDLARAPQLGQEKPNAAFTNTPVAEQLDLATVLNVFEEIGGEIVQEKCIDWLMRAAIEHAGASEGS